jgi:RNA polymerase sigma-70 factor (ECF subfamily)
MDDCIAWYEPLRAAAAPPGRGRWRLDCFAQKLLLTVPMVGRATLDASGQVAADEAALLARVAAGDRGAPLEELYGRYERRLYGLGFRLLGDQGLAEELVQETFVRLWQQARRFDPARGTVSSFLFAIARRIAVDLWRRPSSRPFEPEPAEAEAAATHDPVNGVLEGLAVRDAMQSLSPAHRQILELFYGQDRKQSEIAELLGLPLGTVKTRSYYALRALKLALQERGIDA